jgi:DNA gyrase subunit B
VKRNISKLLKQKNDFNHHLFIFLCDLSEYGTAITKLENRGFDPFVVEILINAGFRIKPFLQDKEKMVLLKNKIEAKGYITESLSWNEEDAMFELIVKSPERIITSRPLPLAEAWFIHRIFKNVLF